MEIGKGLRPQACLTWWNKDCYLHTRKCKSLAASHFWYDWARDLILYSFHQKYESINEINKNFENRPIIAACGFLKHVFFRHSVPTFLVAISLLFNTSKFASFVQQFNRISGRISGYPASRISGKWNRISGRISDIKKGRISDIKKGRISGQPDIRYNPKKKFKICSKTDSLMHFKLFVNSFSKPTNSGWWGLLFKLTLKSA